MSEQAPTIEEIKKLVNCLRRLVSSRVQMTQEEIAELNALELKCRPYDLYGILFAEIEKLRKVVRRMINKSNVVTAYYRHDQTISNESMVELYEAQIEAEEIMGEK